MKQCKECLDKRFIGHMTMEGGETYPCNSCTEQPRTMEDMEKNIKIVVWKDGSYKYINNGITWEYEADEEWLVTIPAIEELTENSTKQTFEMYKCPSYYDDTDTLLNCECGLCGKHTMEYDYTQARERDYESMYVSQGKNGIREL